MASRQLSHANGQAQQTQGLAVIAAPLKSPESKPHAPGGSAFWPRPGSAAESAHAALGLHGIVDQAAALT